MRLIDADEACKLCGAKDIDGCSDECLIFMGNCPTIDAVPVVRCRDCKLRHEFGCPMYYEEELEWDDDGYPEYDVLCHDHTFDDGFCDRGERKDGEG